MSDNRKVRASRDGDQFHYLWAARRCLQLLPPRSELVAVVIEGASVLEDEPNAAVHTGEAVIDVAEYYGSEDFKSATKIRYIQLKHSTLQSTEPWTASALKNTVGGFSDRYSKLCEQYGADMVRQKVEFVLVTNRPIHTGLMHTVAALAQQNITDAPDFDKLRQLTLMSVDDLFSFCGLVRLRGQEPAYWEQRNILFQDIGGYLPDSDVDAPIRLKELVTRKALSESSGRSSITRTDVLKELQTDENHLYPAPCLIERLASPVPREQEPEILSRILAASRGPILIHAAGGIGKSIISTRIGLGMPEGSVAILYDCFGSGEYRNPVHYRHRCKDGIVQISNELAGMGLCHPLIPGPFDNAQYLRAFAYRLEQACAIINSRNPGAVLCLVIDAGDNAEIAANESGDASSFPRQLLRQKFPAGVRLVVTCRSHRRQLLSPPPNTDEIELHPFSEAETAVHLKGFYPGASDLDVKEFHRLSSQNARVQSRALSWAIPLDEMLFALGPTPTSADDTISELLSNSIRNLKDRVGHLEQQQIDRICVGLAVLRPLVPISILAKLSGVDESAVTSFAFDIGRPLMVAGATLQFLDEPSETWFRENFKPKALEFERFVRELEPLASENAYVAGVLPQLMLEAGQLERLVELTLTGKRLPESTAIEKHDIEIQRLQFALKASLRAEHYVSATKLAFKAGIATATDTRQLTLIRDNADLAAYFLDADRIQDLASTHTLSSGWHGSHHLYSAGLLSGKAELIADARSRLRMAHEWLRSWNRLPEKERRTEPVSDQDLAELAMAHLNIEGPGSCARMLRSWMPREVSFQAGTILFSRLIDVGRVDEVVQILEVARNDFALILAGNMQLQRVARKPPELAVRRCLSLLLDRRIQLKTTNNLSRDEPELMAVTSLVRTAISYGVDRTQLLALIERYLPASVPPGFGARNGGRTLSIVRAYALRSTLAGRTLELLDLATDDLRPKFAAKSKHHESQELSEFRSAIEPLLPWLRLWADSILKDYGQPSLERAIQTASEMSAKAEGIYYQENQQLTNEIARIWFELLLSEPSIGLDATQEFEKWIGALRLPLSISTSVDLVRSGGHDTRLVKWCISHAEETTRRTATQRADAETKCTTLMQLARATISVSRSEANAYFNEALQVTRKIGDENLHRWTALLDLAFSARNIKSPSPRRAYLLSRCAELSYAYVASDKHFDWEVTVKAIAGLCPSSCLTILSRWRDRRFGRWGRLLPAAVEFLTESSVLDGRSAAALIGFHGDWRISKLVCAALSSSNTKKQKERIAHVLMRFFILSDADAGECSKAIDLVEADGISAAALRDNCDSMQVSSSTSPYFSPGSDEETNWDSYFVDLDVTLPDQVSAAQARFEAAGTPYDYEKFFESAWRHVKPGYEADFVRSVSENAGFDLYHFKYLLTTIPASVRYRLSLKNAVGDASRHLARRCYSDVINRNRYFESFPFKLVKEIAGISESKIIPIVLASLGEAHEFEQSWQLFSIASLIGSTLVTAEATEALEFGLSLYEDSLDDEDGDGPWSQALRAPESIEFSLAGYIWAALGAPEAVKRWEAAHVVRLQCWFGRTEVVARLVELAQAESAAPFVDERLPFYNLHALQWLVIAFARAAIDDPQPLVPHFDFIVGVALHERPHIVIRSFAAQAAISLIDSGLVDPNAPLRHEQTEVNKSSLPRRGPKMHSGSDEQPSPESATGLSFALDIGPYWFSGLARCFEIKETDVERAARNIIVNELGYAGTAHWIEDPRAQRKIFDESETHHSHGSYPLTDDLHFYLSYHAMMRIGGDLLSTIPLPTRPEDDYDRFDEWLKRHGLTRTDGQWLADRRDACPIQSHWCRSPEKDWPWSLMRRDFDHVLGIGSGRLTVWGDWTEVADTRKQSVSISSALASRHRSAALLRALQTASDPHDYRIPDADAEDQFQLDHGEYRLRGWIVESSYPLRLDEYDPWAGEINYPPIVPAEFVCERMQLRSDNEQRIFKQSGDGMEVLWSQVWGEGKTSRHRDLPRQSGRRLQANRSFLSRLLGEMDMDLIIKVEVERDHHGSRRSWRKSDSYEFMPNSARLFLIRTNGDVITI